MEVNFRAANENIALMRREDYFHANSHTSNFYYIEYAG